MGVRFVHQSIDTDKQYFIGHYRDLKQLYENHQHLIINLFPNPNARRISGVVRKQGFIALLDDQNNIEYRIEIEGNYDD